MGPQGACEEGNWNVSAGGVREEGARRVLPLLLLKTPAGQPEKSVKANLLASLREAVAMKRVFQRKRRCQETRSKARLEPCPIGKAQTKGSEGSRLRTGGRFPRCREDTHFAS